MFLEFDKVANIQTIQVLKLKKFKEILSIINGEKVLQWN